MNIRLFTRRAASICLCGILAAHADSTAPGQAAANPPVQADSGNSLFGIHCASCHASNLAGGAFGPTLKGTTFQRKWSGAAKDNLLDFISKRMPPAEPGLLTTEQYRDIEKFISHMNDDFLSGSPSVDAHRSPPRADPTERHLGPVPAEPQVFADSTFERISVDRKRLLDNLTPVTDELLQAPPAGDWLSWRRTRDMQSFSPLAQIDRKSVRTLSVAWAWALPAGVNESAPLIHDGVIFVQSGNQVQALDAAEGTLLWRYTRDLAPQFRGSLYQLHRSFAIYGENLYISTADRHIVALAAKTGQLVWDHELIPAETPGVALTSGPIAVRGKIIQGASLSLFCKGGCPIIALDALTGAEVWRFSTVAGPSEPGGDTWNHAPMDERSGGAVWTPASYDPQTNLVYFGTGSSYYIGPLLLPQKNQARGNNDALYTDSTLALDADSGHLAWHRQHLAGDLWDLDEAFERTLMKLPIHGVGRNLVVTIGKSGIMDALDPATGSFVFSKDLGLQNFVTAIDAKTGVRTLDPNAQPEPNKAKTICPSPEGVRNWLTTAFNPQTRILYVPMEETCMDFKWQPASVGSSDGHIDIGWSVKPRAGSDGNYGRIEALDMVTRKSLWVRRQRAPLSSSLLATAGGILFQGDRNREFRALDDKTGKTLWSVRLDAVPNSSPVTFRVRDKQYVAVVTGGGGLHDSESIEITPEITNAAPATTLWVFSLPESQHGN